MTKEQSIKGNKLIAEFMGAIEQTEQIKVGSIGSAKAPMGKMYFPNNERFLDCMYTCKIEDLKYHSSWDWIHGAIEKAHDECKLHPAGLRLFDRLTIFSTINQVWERLVQFINWYNQNKQS